MSLSFPDKVFDVAIIGGGINGVGVARDCAMRRLSVILLEKGDFGAGSSGKSSGLIHGGPRYLESERELTREACQDSGALQRIAPNLVYRLPVLIPALRSDPPLYLEKVEAFARAYDRFAALKDGKPHVRLDADEVQALDPGLSAEIQGGVTIDEWGVDPFRLVIATAKSAAMAGAALHPRTRVERIEVQEGKVVGVLARAEGHAPQVIHAKTVVNLAGPWAPFIDKRAMPSLAMRPSKGVHLVLDRRIVNFALVCTAIDGRQSVFLIPREHTTLIGSTDDDFYGHPDHVEITPDEIGYLLQAVERYFPTIRQYRMMRAFAGIRPTVHRWGVNESQLSREHLIHDHARDGADGLYSMIGGRLGSHRLMAEEMTDVLCRRFKKRDRCRTHLEILPGCTTEMPWREEARRTGLDPITVRRLMYRHGHHAEQILDAAAKSPELAQTLCECEQIIAAEAEYCVREEWVKSLADLRRRTQLGSGPCQACRCHRGAALFLGGLLGWSREEVNREAALFVESRWRGNHPVLFGEQAKQEEYARALLLMAARREGEWPSTI